MMKSSKDVVAALSVAVLVFFVVCDNGSGSFSIEDLTAEQSQIAPSGNTTLHCYVDNPDSLQLDYVWEADTGSIQAMGDSAIWTAPDDFTWTGYTATVSVTAGDADGDTDSEDITLQIQVNSQTNYANEDTYVFSYSPDSSYAEGEFLRVGFDSSWGTNDAFFHSYLMFPTPIIPSGEELQGARLRLWREYSESDEMEIEIYLPIENWSSEGLTWNTEPDAVDFAMLSDNITDVGYFYIALTSLVEDWLDGERRNYGLMLRVSDETDYTNRFRDYGSMDGEQSKRPVMEIVSW